MIENPGDYDDDPEEGLAPLIRPRQDPVPDSYLVRLNVDTEQLTETQNIAHPDPQAMNRRIWAAAQRARDVGISVGHEFIIFNAFTATLSREQLRTVRQDPDVAYVQQDSYYYAAD
jgi:hypothetical protein